MTSGPKEQIDLFWSFHFPNPIPGNFIIMKVIQMKGNEPGIS